MTIFGAESLEKISDEERVSDEETASDEEIASDDEVSCDEEEIVDDEEISGDVSEELVAVSETDELISVSSANVICSDEDDPSQATISVAAVAVKIASVFFIFSESPS